MMEGRKGKVGEMLTLSITFSFPSPLACISPKRQRDMTLDKSGARLHVITVIEFT